MKKFKARIKEKGRVNVLEPTFVGDVDIAYLEKFWGVHNDDVEWFEIEEVHE